MKIYRSADSVHIDLSIAEARVFLEELAHVRGGTRLPKLRQVCDGLEALFTLMAPKPDGRKRIKRSGATPGTDPKENGCQDPRATATTGSVLSEDSGVRTLPTPATRR